MNRYLLKGLGFTIAGIACLYYGLQIMGPENNWYKVLLSVGVILFGFGFITLVYRMFRKIDRDTILENRKSDKKEK